MSGTKNGDDCCEIPVCLLIVDVEITDDAQAKLCGLFCNCEEPELEPEPEK